MKEEENVDSIFFSSILSIFQKNLKKYSFTALKCAASIEKI